MDNRKESYCYSEEQRRFFAEITMKQAIRALDTEYLIKHPRKKEIVNKIREAKELIYD